MVSIRNGQIWKKEKEEERCKEKMNTDKTNGSSYLIIYYIYIFLKHKHHSLILIMNE